MSLRRGPNLPYSVVAGVTACPAGWLAASAKIQGATFAPESPKVYPTFLDVLSEKPTFVSVVVSIPIGYRNAPGLGIRKCDVEARALIGRRGASVRNAPTRAVLDGSITWREGGLDAVSATMLPRTREVASEMSPFRQRVVYEANPELSFYQLNQDTPLTTSKQTELGREERRAILTAKMPGIDRVIDASIPRVLPKHLLDAAALLWTARRVFGRAAKRLPAEAEWDSEGVRMEIVY